MSTKQLKTRSSLDPDIVNMLVCLRDWCRRCKSSNFSILINNFQLTDDPFKLVKLYNLCSFL